MVTQARLAAPRSMLGVMDAQRLGVRSASFDAATSNFALTYFPSPVAALSECRRALRPGGRLGLVVHDGWRWQDDSRWSWYRQVLAGLGQLGDERERRFHQPQQVKGVLRAAGFTSVTTVVEPFGLIWSDADEWWTWCWSHGYREVLERFSPTTLDAFHRACLSHLGRGVAEATLPVIVAVAHT
jgi:SAM-dependent methyltransferase